MSFVLIPALKINYSKPSVTQGEPSLGPGEFSEIANFSEDFEWIVSTPPPSEEDPGDGGAGLPGGDPSPSFP